MPLLLDQTIYSLPLFLAEKEAALYLRRLLRSKVEKLPAVVRGLLHRQPEAVEMACSNPVFILTGSAGTGKTTTLKCIIESFDEAGLCGRIMCPTGKASKRASEVVNRGRDFTKRIPCSTVHSGLGWTETGFDYCRTNKLKLDYLIIDEFTFLDAVLLRDVVEAIEPGRTRLIFAGDPNQLPSVGPGHVGRDLVRCPLIPSVTLDVIMRTGEHSGIAYNANKILQGEEFTKSDPESGKQFQDCFFVQRQHEVNTVSTIIQYMFEDLPEKRGFNPLGDVQVICPGKKGIVGTENLNQQIRNKLIEMGLVNREKKIGGLSIGDKIVNKRNLRQKNLVNGDMGTVHDVTANGTLLVNFGVGAGKDGTGEAEFKGSELETLQLAYAITAHTSQGSEFPVEISPIHTCHSRLLFRNLLYMMMTRAQKLSLCLGDYEAFRRGVKNTVVDQRRTCLADYMKAT